MSGYQHHPGEGRTQDASLRVLVPPLLVWLSTASPASRSNPHSCNSLVTLLPRHLCVDQAHTIGQSHMQSAPHTHFPISLSPWPCISHLGEMTFSMYQPARRLRTPPCPLPTCASTNSTLTIPPNKNPILSIEHAGTHNIYSYSNPLKQDHALLPSYLSINQLHTEDFGLCTTPTANGAHQPLAGHPSLDAPLQESAPAHRHMQTAAAQSLAYRQPLMLSLCAQPHRPSYDAS